MPFVPDVVLSFSHADRVLAEQLATELSAAGLKVRWDEPIIAPDEHREKTAAAIRAARAVIALWTPHAMDNRWVMEEADEARRLGKLVSVVEPGIKREHLPETFRDAVLLGLGNGAGLTQALRRLGVELQSELPGHAAVVAESNIVQLRPEPERETVAAVHGSLVNAAMESVPETVVTAAVVDPPVARTARPHLRLRKRASAPGERRPALGVAAAAAAVVVVTALLLSSGLLQALTN